LNGGDDLGCDPGGNFFAVCECDVIMGAAQLPECLLGPFDHLPVDHLPDNSASVSGLLEPLYDLLMADDATFSHLFQPLANQRVLGGVQFDVAGNRLVDEITARPVLRGGNGIKRVSLFGIGAEADGFPSGAHDTGEMSYLRMYRMYHKTLFSVFSGARRECRMVPTPTHS
jgi:hypothetical protein